MNVIKLIVVSPAGWTNRQEHVPDYLREEKGEARIAGRLADCLATTTGMPREPMNYQRFQFLDTTGSIFQLLFRCDYR